MKNKERLDAERVKYDGMTQKEVREYLASVNESVFGGGIEGNIRELYNAIRDEPSALTYLAEVYAERTGKKVRTIPEHGIESVRRRGMFMLLNDGKLPNEVYDARCGNASWDIAHEVEYVGL